MQAAPGPRKGLDRDGPVTLIEQMFVWTAKKKEKQDCGMKLTRGWAADVISLGAAGEEGNSGKVLGVLWSRRKALGSWDHQLLFLLEIRGFFDGFELRFDGFNRSGRKHAYDDDDGWTFVSF